MPRTEQIIPKYNVPHLLTVVNNNSTVAPVANVTAADPSIRFLYIFPSERGKDGCITIRSTSEYINTFGTPNFKKYGQAPYMPYLSLSTGKAICHCIRITPPDASYANVVIMANVSKSENEVTVTYTATSIVPGESDKGLVDLDTFAAKVDALKVDGSKYPVVAFASNGRGVYGDNLRIILSSMTSVDNARPYKSYNAQLIDTSRGATPLESFEFSMDVAAILDKKPMYVMDTINDPETGSSNIVAYANDEFIDAVYNAYSEVCTTAGDTPVPLNEFDILFGKTKSSLGSTDIAHFKIGTESISGSPSVKLDATLGTAFNGGSDGAFAEGAEGRDNAIVEEYKKAMFIGSDDKFLEAFPTETSRRYGSYASSKRRTPTDIILDANYPDAVKLALYELALRRSDARLTLDSGIHATSSALFAWDKTFANSDDVYYFTPANEDEHVWVTSRENSWGKVRDPFTGKIINVTYTWILAQQLPHHYIDNGTHIPFTGERYTLVSGFIPNSIRPIVDADDLETKEAYYTRRINTVDTLGENRYIRATQVTVDPTMSDLSEEHNVMVLLEMKRALENLVLSKLYDFSDNEDRLRFTSDAERLFETYPNRKVRTYSVYFDMNEFEQARSILHCYLAVTFRQISTRGIVEIDINSRV
jgi:hypothetical protein